ncbi:MAG: low specificity L-threonine aldolase [Phycisphaeraceae bacterium]
MNESPAHSHRTAVAGPGPRQFASDNGGGICPEAWQAMERANVGHAAGYGDDDWTRRACDAIRAFFETDCQVFFTFTGTAANSLALASLCRSYHSIICHELAHVETDECGGPEFFSNGTKVLLAPGDHGKLDLAGVEHIVTRRSDVHYPKPRVLSVTQPTEMGTVYSVAELEAVGELARRLGLRVHMDGARLANAVASLDVAPRAITWQAGVDVLCLGGTKNGLAAGEAVVFFDPQLACEFEYRCKQAGQLASKMRFLSAPWLGVLETGAYLDNARRANAAAALLARLLGELPGVKVMHPVQANAVFVRWPDVVSEALRDAGWHFYDFIAAGGVRLMCAWDTTHEDVRRFVDAVRQAIRGPG